MDFFLSKPNPQPAITAAIKAYLKASPMAPTALIEVEKVNGEFARVRVREQENRITPATAYLRCQAGRWSVLAMGTHFNPADLDKLRIPSALRR